MSKYIIKLTPSGRFFFGGDMTFSVGEQPDDKNKKKDFQKHNEKFSSYIITSLKFPQQTSLLGMLRFLLLSNDNNIFCPICKKIKDGKKEEAKQLIGEKSFTVNEKNHEENSFGKIKRIGPCVLCKGNEYYYQAPLDYGWKIVPFEGVTATFNGKSIEIPEMKDINNEKISYSSKRGIHKCYLSSNGSPLDDVFMEDRRVGIRKGINGKTEEDAFYKQIGYRLKDDCCFAFDVEVDDTINLTQYKNQLVSIGADSSMFYIEIEKGSIDVCLPATYETPLKDSWEKVVLLSDTYLPDTSLEEFAISETKPFRFFRTTVDTEKYHIMHNWNNRSERYRLYAAGSVFFVKKGNVEYFKKCISSKREFVQIGYNIIVNKKN